MKNKVNSKALHLVTLFLLTGFAAASGVCQQTPADAGAVKLSISNYELRNEERSLVIKKTARDFSLQPRAGFFAKENFSSEKANSFNAKKAQTTYTRPTRDERLKKYLKRTFGVYALLGDAASAGVAQAFDTPEEWENNGKGYARRFGSTLGRSAITETVSYGLDEALKLDSNFYPSGSKKFGDRFKNAFLSTFAARKPHGKRVFGAPRIAGAYASGIIASEVWYPKRYNFADGLQLGTVSLGVDFGVNLLREFFGK